jgi:predicted dehydrogenase
MQHRCLLVGFGNIAQIHAKYLEKHNIQWDWYDPNVECGDLNRVAALNEQLFKNVNYTRVFILTPESLHYQHYKMIRSMYNGWIFVEKPAALEGGQIAEMFKDPMLCIGLVERFNPAVQTLKRHIDREQLVNIDFSRCCVADDSSATAILEDIGIHDLDIYYFLTGCDGGDYTLSSSGNTVILTVTKPHLCRFIWSKDTYFKERKIIVRQSDYTLVADLQEQSVIKYYYHEGKVVSESIYVEKSSPIENEQRNFLSHRPEKVHGSDSHYFLMEILDR